MTQQERLTHRIEARATLEQARRFAEETSRVLGAWGLPVERLASWEMAVAEMATNVSRHGYPGRAPGPMALQMDWDDDGLRITVEDEGVEYDPSKVPPPREPDPDDPDTWPEGGMGIMLVRASGDELAYRRRGRSNHLTLFTRIPRNAVL